MSDFKILDPGNFSSSGYKYELPLCEADISPQSVRYRVDKSKTCGRRASVQILGKNYCKKHGGLVLLDLLASGRLSINE